MNDEEKSLLSVLENDVTSNAARIAIIQLKNNKSIDALSGLVFTIKKAIVGIIFVLTIIFFRLFGWTSLVDLFNNIGELKQVWINLSDNTQILILGFLSAIVSGIITAIISHSMTVRIKSFLGKAKSEEVKKAAS